MLPHHAYKDKTRNSIKLIVDKVITESLDLCEEAGITAEFLDFLNVDGGIFNTLCTEKVDTADPDKNQTASDMVRPRNASVVIRSKEIVCIWDFSHTEESALNDAKKTHPRIDKLLKDDKVLISYLNTPKNAILFRIAKGVPKENADALPNYCFTRFMAWMARVIEARNKYSSAIFSVLKQRSSSKDQKAKAKALEMHCHFTSAYNTVAFQFLEKALDIFRVVCKTSQESFVSTVMLHQTYNTLRFSNLMVSSCLACRRFS